MQNLNAIHALNTRPSSTRYTGIAFAVLINGTAIWAIMNGLNIHPSAIIPPELQIHMIQQSNQPKTPVLPPPKPVMQKVIAQQVVVPVPVIDIAPQPQQPSIDTTTKTQPSTPTIADSGPSGLTNTHTTPPYPADARNLGQQGTVTLMLSIDTTGAVTNAQVKTSSGSAELDQTAVNWVIAHWRYKPAIQNGQPVASMSLAAVKFDLHQTR